MFEKFIEHQNKQRHLTEDEHIKLVEVGDKFWEDFGKLAAQAISQFPEEIENIVIAHLQDKCSIYGSEYKGE